MIALTRLDAAARSRARLRTDAECLPPVAGLVRRSPPPTAAKRCSGGRSAGCPRERRLSGSVVSVRFANHAPQALGVSPVERDSRTPIRLARPRRPAADDGRSAAVAAQPTGVRGARRPPRADALGAAAAGWLVGSHGRQPLERAARRLSAAQPQASCKILPAIEPSRPCRIDQWRVRMNTRRAVSAWFFLPLVLFALAAPAAAQPAGPDLVRDLKWRNIGPANMSGRISDIEALDADFSKVLVATASGGVFKSDQRRHHLGADLRQVLQRVDRRRRLVPEEPRHHLGRHRRGVRPQQRGLGRRHLQVDRRRQDVRQHGPQGHRQHRQGPPPPDRPQRRLRGGQRPRVGLHRRPRPVQDDRRRQDLAEARRRPAERRQDGRHRHGDAPDEPERPLRHLLAAPPPALPLRLRRPERRHLPVHRRRQDLEEADDRPPDRRPRPHRHHHQPLQAERPDGHRRARLPAGGAGRRASRTPTTPT